jgi:integration host factor subunit alpha
MSDSITKNSLAKVILYETGIPVSIAQAILDSLFENIINFTIKDEEMKIPKFGSFYVKSKKPRIGRNINTQESVMINARKVVSFYPSSQLKQEVNEKS